MFIKIHDYYYNLESVYKFRIYDIEGHINLYFPLSDAHKNHELIIYKKNDLALFEETKKYLGSKV